MKNRLDLHGIKHADVFKIVDNFIGKHIIYGTDSVEIITGYSQRMKDLVIDVLNDYQVSSENHRYNSGVLIIDLK
ncbi:MAG: Smr/MutS family protein [Bacteroidota bacterium]